jgi:hypothetical protein
MAGQGFFLVRMDVAHDHEATVNEVYGTGHVPNLAVVKGVQRAGDEVRHRGGAHVGGASRRALVRGACGRPARALGRRTRPAIDALRLLSEERELPGEP